MDVIQAIKERRSINFFEPGKELSEDKIKELLELANLSPSSMNLQPWRVIVVRTPERKQILRAAAFNQPKVEEASAVLIIIADPLALEENMEAVLDRNVELGYLTPERREGSKAAAHNLYGDKDSLKRKIFAVKNTALFAMGIMIAARGLGLETHPMDGFNAEQIKKEFHIPEHCIVPMLIAVGTLKLGTQLLPRAFRRRIDAFVSFA